MKKTLFLMLAFFAISCVDRDFDPYKIDDKKIVFGDKFILPMGTIKIDLAEFFDSPLPTKSTFVTDKEAQQVLVENKTKTYKMHSGAITGALKFLSEKEEHAIEATVISGIEDIDFDLTFKVGTTTILVPAIKKDTIKEVVSISKNMLNEFAKTEKIEVEFIVNSGGGVRTIPKGEAMSIEFKLNANGGLKL